MIFWCHLKIREVDKEDDLCGLSQIDRNKYPDNWASIYDTSRLIMKQDLKRRKGDTALDDNNEKK